MSQSFAIGDICFCRTIFLHGHLPRLGGITILVAYLRYALPFFELSFLQTDSPDGAELDTTSNDGSVLIATRQKSRRTDVAVMRHRLYLFVEQYFYIVICHA